MLVLQLAIILFASKIAGDISVKFGQPSVLGKLLIGIIIGPSVLGLVNETETLGEFSQIGVILLMFLAGLETNLVQLKKTWKASTFVGLGGIFIPLGIGYVSGMMLHLTPLQSAFLGLLLSATSVSISVQALKEMNQLKTREGLTILGAAVIDDVVVIVALAFLMSLAGGDINLGMVILKKVLFFVGVIFVGWKLVPGFLQRFSKLKVSETVVTSAFIICFVFAYLAEYTGVAAIIGAYMAGVSISRTKFKDQVFKKVETISYTIFVPVFFTSIGITAHFDGMAENVGLIVMLSIMAILTKLIGASLGARVAGFSWNSSMGIGSAMVSRGEVALIISAIGLESNLLSQELFAAIIVVIIITTVVTPPMMKMFLDTKRKRKA